MSALAPPYLPRQPQQTVLYKLVKEHLDDFLRHAHEAYEAPLPKYVENEFRNYLACGDFSRGVVLVQCEACHHHLAVAFSCKMRTLCPSCAGRRMAGEAAYLVDRVLPSVPIRQYVLAFPYELSGLAATKPAVLRALARIFWESVRQRYRRWAKNAGLSSSEHVPETGAVTATHRAGSSLNLHVHFHMMVLDGVYIVDAIDASGQPVLRFEQAPPPSPGELQALVEHIYARVMKWLRRRGLLRQHDDLDDRPDDATSPTEALALFGMQRGTLVAVRNGAADLTDDDASDVSAPPPPPPKSGAAVHERFNLHASVRINASDDLGRERLARYLTRPAFALGRFHLLRDGSVAYRVKKATKNRVTERVMAPVECLARLAAIIAPPGFPLLTFAGVLAPRHALRRHVVPKPPSQALAHRSRPCHGDDPKSTPGSHPPRPNPASSPNANARTPARSHGAPASQTLASSGDGRSAFLSSSHSETSSAADVSNPALQPLLDAQPLAPNILSADHWARIRHGELFAPSSRPQWALLLRRTFRVDVQTCPLCGGRLSIRSLLPDQDAVAAFLHPPHQQAHPRAPPAPA